MQHRIASLSLFVLLASSVYGFRLLPDSSIFNQDISNKAPKSNSAAIIEFLGGHYGGNFEPGGFQLDESMYLLNTSTPGVHVVFDSIEQSDEYHPDCNGATTFPIVTPGGIEGTNPPTYSKCSGDCHIAVVDPAGKAFYDSYVSKVVGPTLHTNCAIKWCSNFNYPDGRGTYCTSCDAAGFPITALLLTADELASGVLDHALRFILPGSSMGYGFVLPATHGTSDGHSTDPNAPLYGYRFRLKADFDTTGYNHASKIVIKGLQTYGMFLSDEGNIPITISNDKFSTAKYATFHFNTHSLYNIKPSDFEVMPFPGVAHPVSGDCHLQQNLPSDCLTAQPIAARLTP